MPGLTTNDRVTEALNQLIAAVNDVSSQLTTLSGKVDANLPAMVQWQEYLKYLKDISENIGNGALQSDHVFGGDFGNPVTVTGKCRVSNSLFDHIYYCCDRAGEKITGLANDNAGLLLQIVNIFSSLRSPVSYGDYQTLLITAMGNVIDFDGLATKLLAAKTAIVTAIFTATTGAAVKAAFFDNLTSLTTGQTLWLTALLLPEGVTSSVLNEDYWYSWEDPASPVLCGDPPDVVIQSSINYPYNTMITGSVNFMEECGNSTWGYPVTSVEAPLTFSSSASHTVTSLQISFVVTEFTSNSFPVSCYVEVGTGSANVVMVNGAGSYNHTVNVSGTGTVEITFHRDGDEHQFWVNSIKVEIL